MTYHKHFNLTELMDMVQTPAQQPRKNSYTLGNRNSKKTQFTNHSLEGAKESI